MKRLLLTVSAVAAMSALATAQCFETNLGTSIGLGDDLVLAVTPMNITFPMGGIAASYTHVQPTTNGLCYLTNGVAAVGATGTGYSSAAATMVTNLRGLAGQNPRIGSLAGAAPGCPALPSLSSTDNERSAAGTPRRTRRQVASCSTVSARSGGWSGTSAGP